MARVLTPPTSCDENTQQRRRRRPTERSRSGCLTCRVRKIKCDQKRPFCERCTSTGRRCEGPPVQGFQFVHEEASKLVMKARSPSLSAIIQPDHGPSDTRERRAFHFFLNAAAPTMSGAFDSGFWSRFVPQISHVEPAVRHALLAIGQLFDTPLRPLEENKIALGAVPTIKQKALTWYSTAVHELQRAMDRGPQSIALGILSCLLFVCVEYQLHNPSSALCLLQRGMRLLEITLDDARQGIQRLDPTASAIFEAVIPFMTRHAMLAATFGQPPPPEWKLDAKNFELLEHDWSSIETLDEARVSLYALMYQGNAFVRIAWLLDRCPTPSLALVAGQRQLAAKIDAWRTAYEKLRIEPSASSTGDMRPESSYLLVYQGVLRIWVATCTSPFQEAFDTHLESFKEIVRCAEIDVSMHRCRPIPGADSPYAHAPAMVPPLYFVATKCRHPTIRRRALSLLEMVPHEGMWKALPILSVVRKIIELEEEVYDDIKRPPDAALRLPAEAARIHHFEIISHGFSSHLSSTCSIRVLRLALDEKNRRRWREEIVALEPQRNSALRTSTTWELPNLPTSTPYLDSKYL